MTPTRPLPSRIVGVLRRPRVTFQALAGSPCSAGVLVVAFLAAASAGALVLDTEVGELALLDQLERTVSAVERPTDEAQYAVLRDMSQQGTAYAVVTALISGPLLAVGLSAVFVGVLRAPADGGVTYRQVLAVVSHAGVILALRQVIAAPLVYARETMASPLTLGTFFTVLDEASPLARFAGMLDLFILWWLVVLAVGMSVLYRRPTGRLALVFTGAYIGVAALVAVALALTGGAL